MFRRSTWSALLAVAFLSGSQPVSMEAAPKPSLFDVVAEREYLPAPGADGALGAPNRAHGLRLKWTAEGVEITDRLGGDRLVSLATTSLGRGSTLERLDPVAPQMGTSARVERQWAQVSEWWKNSAEGVEQGWVVTTPPPGAGGLVLQVAVRDAELRATGVALEFAAASGRCLSYGKLAAFDATGRELAVHLSPEASGAFRIEIDDEGARYPVTIDPVITASADWTFSGATAGSQAGFSVAGAGDVNGDGFADVIVGAPSFDNGSGVLGTAFVFHGGVNGLSTAPTWIAPMTSVGGQFGISVASAGDVNGDGFGDVIVGASSFTNVEAQEGRAQLFFGSPSGLPSLGASWVKESNQVTGAFGVSVAGAGDVNGDGYDDVLVGALGLGVGGRVSLFLGSAAGPAQLADWTHDGEMAGAGFGGSLATAGDVNGDGLSDVIIGATAHSNPEVAEGKAYLFRGQATAQGLEAGPSWTFEGDQSSASLGSSVSTAGDVNGDGLSDVIVGARGFSNNQPNEGRALVFLANGMGTLESAARFTIELGQANAAVGSSVSAAGDVNGDGYADVLVGASQFDGVGVDEGTVRLFLGASASLRPETNGPGPLNLVSANLGRSVAAAGDVNGDGFSDFVVGAPGFGSGGPGRGQARLYLGSARGPSTSPSSSVNGTRSGGLFGKGAAFAQDVDNDGFGDIVIGAPQEGTGALTWEGAAHLFQGPQGALFGQPTSTFGSGTPNGFLGYAVASAGDINGDGYADTIVGAYGAGVGGRAYLFMGSASGWPPSPTLTLEPGQAGAQFGISVAGAGDVNGDGYADVIVGAQSYDDAEPDEGAAFLYLGSGAGLIATPERVLQVNQPQGAFGVSVASAGDVNGDRFSDVVVGALGLDKAFIFFGAPTAPTGGVPQTLSHVTGSWFGASVAGAGDINGDGFSDVIVGAPSYDNGQVDEGAFLTFSGSASGVGAGSSLESNVAGAQLGISVSSAGDVNGDGFDDVLVGAPRALEMGRVEGSAMIFAGQRAGLKPTPIFRAVGGQLNAAAGSVVAGGGDVNGDGFGDALVTLLDFDGVSMDLGQVQLLLGGDGAAGAERRLRQASAGVPVGAGGWVRPPVQVSARALRADFPSSSKVTVEFEVKPVGTAFDGGATLFSTPVATGQSAAVTVPVIGPNRYHWRSRVRFKSGAGRWISFGANHESVADFVVAAVVDAGVRIDAGVSMDAGALDAGLSTDAGAPGDAGPSTDAGVSNDAGVSTDAGVEKDAGLSSDAGVIDAGVSVVDAGVSPDAGSTPDAGSSVVFIPVCGCDASSDGGPALLLVLLVLANFRWRQ